MDDEFEETQWTDAARERFAASAEELIDQIRRHVDLTTGRAGRQRELGPYFESAEKVHEAVVAFTDAEFDWCGSTSVKVRRDDEWEDEEGDDEDEDTGDILSVVGRWDFRVTDPDAFVAAGRRAYVKMWPDDTDEDAEIRVQTPHHAVGELLHGRGLRRIEKAPGVEPVQFWTHSVLHDGSRTDDMDPFAIVRE